MNDRKWDKKPSSGGEIGEERERGERGERERAQKVKGAGGGHDIKMGSKEEPKYHCRRHDHPSPDRRFTTTLTNNKK